MDSPNPADRTWKEEYASPSPIPLSNIDIKIKIRSNIPVIMHWVPYHTISDHVASRWNHPWVYLFYYAGIKIIVPFLIYLKEFKLLLVGSLYVFIILSLVYLFT